MPLIEWVDSRGTKHKKEAERIRDYGKGHIAVFWPRGGCCHLRVEDEVLVDGSPIYPPGKVSKVDESLPKKKDHMDADFDLLKRGIKTRYIVNIMNSSGEIHSINVVDISGKIECCCDWRIVKVIKRVEGGSVGLGERV